MKHSINPQHPSSFTQIIIMLTAIALSSCAHSLVQHSQQSNNNVAVGTEDNKHSKHKSLSEPLDYFYYMEVNAFALYRIEFMLKQTENGGGLTIDKGFHDDMEIQKVSVDKEVMENVRNMINSGKLYDLKDQYMPEFEITDATSWSLDMYAGDNKISSGGYAQGPDHREALNEILSYLEKVYQPED